MSPTTHTASSPLSILISGNIYYINSGLGSDTNPGTSSYPFKSIQKAANVAMPGDTVMVLAGSYNERVQITRSGSAGAPITFLASGTVITQGFTVKASYITIKGFEITNTPDNDTDGRGIYVQGNYCDLENNYIHYATRGGILLTDQSSNCIVRNNRLYRNSQNGLEVNGQNHLIAGNEIWGTIQYHPAWINPPSWVDADGIRFFGSGHVFRGNYIHDISLSDPLNVNPHIDAFQTWDSTTTPAGSNCTFEQNVISLGTGAAGFQLEGGTHDLLIRNNIINSFSGIMIYQTTQAPYTIPNNINILNNLIRGSLSYSPNSYPEGVSVQNVGNNKIVVTNNIFAEQRGQTIWVISSPGLNADYNLFYNSDGSTPLGTPHAHDLWKVNPMFVDPSAGDYHLQAGSAAIDAGVNLGNLVPNDFDGNLRPQGVGDDLGAFEIMTSSPVTSTITPSAIPTQPLSTSVSAPFMITPDPSSALSVGSYDDPDAGWTYTGSWTALSSMTGPYNGTDHRTNDLSATASFTFTGTKFIYYYVTHTSRGQIGVWVDGTLIKTINANGTLKWQSTYVSPVLPAGTHTVVFKNASSSTGYYIDVDAISIIP